VIAIKPLKFFVPALLCLSLLCSCSVDGDDDGSLRETDSQAAVITLESFAKANSLGTTFKEHKTVMLNTIYHDENGAEKFSEFSSINLHNDVYTTLYEDSDGYVEFTSGDRTYIFDTEDNSFTIRFYVDNQQDSYTVGFKDSIFYLSSDEKLVDARTSGGVSTVTLEAPTGDKTSYLGEYCDIDSYDKVIFLYECDAKTLQIKSLSVSAASDESEVLLCVSTFSYSNDSLSTPQFVSELNNSKKTRAVTLHYDGITKYTLANEARFSIEAPVGYAVFSDADGKKPLKDIEKASGDMTIFMLEDK
jgi:hypothetical protein